MIDVSQDAQIDPTIEVVNREEMTRTDTGGHATHKTNITVEAIDIQVEVEVEEMSSSSGEIQTLGKTKILAEAGVMTGQESTNVCKRPENALMLMVEEIREVEKITGQQTITEETNNPSNATTDAVIEKIVDLLLFKKTIKTSDQTNAKQMIRQMMEIGWQGCRVRSEGP